MDFYPFNYKELVLSDGNKAVVRCHGTHLCGYVALPIDSVPKEWHDNYNADALQYLSIHGGITYCRVEPKENPQFVVFGFDCAHLYDEEEPDLRDPEFVMKLTRSMEQQITAYTSRINEWRASDENKRIEIIDEIITNAPVKVELGLGAILNSMCGGSAFKGVK